MSSARFIQYYNSSNLQKHFHKIILGITKLNLSLTRSKGTLAQLVEQRTENPCVPGSIPGGTTKASNMRLFLFYAFINLLYLTLLNLN